MPSNAINGKSNLDDSSLMQVLQSRNDTLTKEREAVQTIMEQKIKVLVQSVAQAANAVTAGAAGSQQGAAQALTKVTTFYFIRYFNSAAIK